jgi:hypothetical protein
MESQLAFILLGILGASVAGFGIYFVLRFVFEMCSGMMAWAAQQRSRGEAVKPIRAFPVQTLDDGFGEYRVEGVLRQTENEVEWVIEARSRANAIAKAEIRGMVVTQAEKINPASEARGVI